MKSIKEAVYNSFGSEVVDSVSDQIDSLEVIAEFLGYRIDINDWQTVGVYEMYIFNGNRIDFSMSLTNMPIFNLGTAKIQRKYIWLKVIGQLPKAINLHDGLVIAQKLLYIEDGVND